MLVFKFRHLLNVLRQNNKTDFKLPFYVEHYYILIYGLFNNALYSCNYVVCQMTVWLLNN